MENLDLVKLGFIIAFIGIMVIFIASILLIIPAQQGGGEANVSVGGCVIIFFIPICFGYGEPRIMILAMILSIVLVIILIILPYILYRKTSIT